MTQVIIDFANELAAKHFALWLSGAGEQDYWMWMEAREAQERLRNISATRFKYNRLQKDADGNFNIDTVLGSVLDNEEE